MDRPKKRKEQLLRITWIDSSHPQNSGWMFGEELEEYKQRQLQTIVTVGWMIDENKHRIILASSKGEDEAYLNLIRIPVGVIKSRRIVR